MAITEQSYITQSPDQSIELTRVDLVKQIQARLAGQLDDSGLAAWAFDRFYAEETGQIDYETGSEPVIAEVLDTLMFGDDPSFRLNEDELWELVVRLGV